MKAGSSYGGWFGATFGVSIAALGVAIGLAWQTVTLALTSLVGAFALSGGLLEVLLDDIGRSRSAKRSKAMARLMALPSTLGAIGLVVLRGDRSPGLALTLGLLAMCGPVIAVLALTIRWRLLTALAAAGLAGGPIAGVIDTR